MARRLRRRTVSRRRPRTVSRRRRRTVSRRRPRTVSRRRRKRRLLARKFHTELSWFAYDLLFIFHWLYASVGFLFGMLVVAIINVPVFILAFLDFMVALVTIVARTVWGLCVSVIDKGAGVSANRKTRQTTRRRYRGSIYKSADQYSATEDFPTPGRTLADKLFAALLAFNEKIQSRIERGVTGQSAESKDVNSGNSSQNSRRGFSNTVRRRSKSTEPSHVIPSSPSSSSPSLPRQRKSSQKSGKGDGEQS